MKQVTVDVHDGVATMTLSNPQSRNRLSAEMVAQIEATIDALEADGSTRVLIVTGAGTAFCAGADLGDLASLDGDRFQQLYRGFLRVGTATMPTIAAVNGPAIGAGMNLALACDVRVAARSALFDSRFLQLGLHPGGGHTWMLRRTAGVQTAMMSTLFGETFDGEQAERVGLVHRCVDDHELLGTAKELARRAAAVPRELSRLAKRTVVNAGAVTTLADAVALEFEPQMWSTQQPFFAAGIAAARKRSSPAPPR